MAAISFATPAASATDPAPSQATSDKGRAFVSTFSDAAQQAAKPIESKSQSSDSKEKDKADKDDRRDDSTTATAVPAHHAASAASHAHDDKADDRKSEGKDKSSRGVAASSAKSAKADDAEPADVDTSESPVDAAELAPVLDALKQAASATQQVADEAPAPQPETPAAQAANATVAAPLPATASLLAARIVPAAAQQADAKAAVPTKKNARADAAADATAAIDASTAGSGLGTDQKSSLAPDSGTVAQPGAGQQLAAGGTDRALDVAKQGAWLDGLARDIAATGSTSSTLRFQAAPTHLGSVQVEIARGLEGAAVTLTASSEGARTALADAKPQLIAEARAQGIHIASAQVDVSTDSRQSNSGSQPDQRHDPRGGTSFSSQTGGEGGQNRQSQTRSQPFAINQTSESQPAATAETDDSVASSAPAGGMYA